MDDVVVLNMPAELEEVLPAAQRAPHALAVLGLVVALMVSGLVPNVQAALIGCLLMGLFGCVDFNSAYRSINWKTLILIVGMLPFSLALQRTGGVDLAADAVVDLVGGAAPRLVLATLFVITAGLGLFISNTATAVLMAPVALAIAKELGASPYPFAMIVALAASTAFMTPISSPVNTLVVGPGQYSFGDFVKVGAPFSCRCCNRERAARSNIPSAPLELGGRFTIVAFDATFSLTAMQRVLAVNAEYGIQRSERGQREAMKVRSLALAAVALYALAVATGLGLHSRPTFASNSLPLNSTAGPSDGGMTMPAPEVIPQI